MNGFTLFAANEKTFLLLYLYKTLYVKSVLCSEVQHLLKVFDFSGPPWTDFGGRSMKPAASASSFWIFYKNENFVTPLWKMRFPRKNVDTWPPTPQQKSEWSVLFSSSHIFVFFFNLSFVFEISEDMENSIVLEFMQMQIFKIHRPQKSGGSKIWPTM